jgi:hypothetical protein
MSNTSTSSEDDTEHETVGESLAPTLELSVKEEADIEGLEGAFQALGVQERQHCSVTTKAGAPCKNTRWTCPHYGKSEAAGPNITKAETGMEAGAVELLPDFAGMLDTGEDPARYFRLLTPEKSIRKSAK